MIISNGTISFKKKTEGGIDPVTRFPKKPTVTWTKPIPCQYYPVNLDFLAKTTEANYTKQSYRILIDGESSVLPSEQIILVDDEKGEIGEFSIINIKHMAAVDQIFILV